MQPDDDVTDPAATLLAAARRAVPGWLRRATVEAGRQGGGDVSADHRLDAVVERAAAELFDRLDELLGTDVDD